MAARDGHMACRGRSISERELRTSLKCEQHRNTSMEGHHAPGRQFEKKSVLKKKDNQCEEYGTAECKRVSGQKQDRKLK